MRPREWIGPPPPTPVGDQAPQPLNLTGNLVPSDAARQPVLLRMPGAEALFLPTFSTPAALDVFRLMNVAPIARVLQITDGREWLESIPKDIRVIIDVRPHDGAIRFTEVFR